MIIYLDFDGTCVEHEFPNIGRENFGCIPVIKKLINAGHTIILNTYRIETGDGHAQMAIDWLMYRLDDDYPFPAVCSKKNPPPLWDWNRISENHVMFIDDQASRMPLKSAVMTNGKMVDWDYLDKEFEQRGIYKAINTEQ